jgi:hypothetical protein
MNALRFALAGLVFAVAGVAWAGEDDAAVVEEFASCSSPESAAPMPAVAYRGIGITTVPGGESVEADRGVVWFKVRLAPAELANGHALTFALNGKRLPITETGLEFSLAGIERGAYTIQASVVDTDGNEIIGSQPLKFFVRQTWWLTPGLSGLL